MAFLDELSAYIKANGIATTVYLSSKVTLPTGTGPYIQLIETTGIMGERIQNQIPSHLEHNSVQVTVRATDYPAAYNKCKEVYRLFEKIRGVFLPKLGGGQVKYLDMVLLQNVCDRGLDDTGRAQTGFNAVVTKEPS
jgi:hypothetical protein